MAGSRVRTEQRISRERAPGYENLTDLGPFQGATAAPVIAGDYEYVCIEAYYRGTAGNLAGAVTAAKNLATVNAGVFAQGVSFPGGAGDDNAWVVPFVLPENYDPTRPIEIIVNMLQE